MDKIVECILLCTVFLFYVSVLDCKFFLKSVLSLFLSVCVTESFIWGNGVVNQGYLSYFYSDCDNSINYFWEEMERIYFFSDDFEFNVLFHS